ncbi:hypothetical protein BD560DRAFT_194693 [Blakeslea trispora]|nr:hypothetical protein BD560DRAFT_194693 [Blakeslea trispora]
MAACLRGDYPTMKHYNAARRLKKDRERQIEGIRKRSEDVYHKEILCKTRQGAYCDSCGHKSPLKGTLIPDDNVSEFLIIVDPVNYIPENIIRGQLKEPEMEVYFPETFSISAPSSRGSKNDCMKVEYALHARMYSTHPTGVHFFSIGRRQTRALQNRQS